MYEKGDSSYVDLLHGIRFLSELLNKAEYIGKISAYDRQKLDEYVATKEQIQAKEAELEAEHGGASGASGADGGQACVGGAAPFRQAVGA